MNFPVILASANVTDFVSSWSKFYQYRNYDEYRRLIAKTKFEEADVKWLFEWKNGMTLSSDKENSYKRNIEGHIGEMIKLKEDFDPQIFKKHFEGMSAVWQIFLLHVLQPDYFPIFDQHVYRAKLFISGEVIETLPNSGKKVIAIYHNTYLKFFQGLLNSSPLIDRFELDKALWVFGKLIKEPKTKSKLKTCNF